jgi:hypothetical protein
MNKSLAAKEKRRKKSEYKRKGEFLERLTEKVCNFIKTFS